MEHPFYGSWGYQTTGYFAPTQPLRHAAGLHVRSSTTLHQAGIGVILDWVPSHFPTDEHGLAYFDGTHLYEHADPRQGFHPDWSSCIFNYGRNEVRSFLISSALHWLDAYHVDGLRVDAVASMLYLDYSRKRGRVDPERATAAARTSRRSTSCARLNEARLRDAPRRADDRRGVDGLADGVAPDRTWAASGFGLKWDMGWMHDTLEYFANDPIHRSYHHDELTFRALYAFTENFVLPLSHDEVVHGKGSLLAQMPGDDWQKFANLRAAATATCTPCRARSCCSWATSSASGDEWNHETSLDWHLLDAPPHARRRSGSWPISTASTASEPALHELDCRRVRLRVGRRERHARPASSASCAAAASGDTIAVRVQLHAGAALELPDRRAARGQLARDPEQRRRPTTAAAARATSARSRPCRFPCTAADRPCC